MKKYIFVLSMICAVTIISPIQANAIDYAETEYQQVISERAVPYAEGIITSYSLSCSKADKAVKINAKTFASAEMKEVGFKDIVVQKSTDNSNWIDEVDVGKKTTTSASMYNLVNYSVSVEGGNFYRVKCTHYAKEKGLFGGSQSVENYSNSVWVD